MDWANETVIDPADFDVDASGDFESGADIRDELSSAISAEAAVAVHYTKANGADAGERVISPWQFNDERETVLLYDHLRDRIGEFRVDGISSVEPTSAEYVRPKI